jgi:uncharacterized protein (DUF1778 family)
VGEIRPAKIDPVQQGKPWMKCLSVMTTSGDLGMLFCGGQYVSAHQPHGKARSPADAGGEAALRLAAASARESVSDFVLKSALARADEVLADRRVIKLNDEQWKAFMAALDAPPKPRPRLKRLLSEPSIPD